MNIFNDAARPHRATWLSPFFVVIEFSLSHVTIMIVKLKAGFRGAETQKLFREAWKKVNLPSCLSDGLVWWLHWLETEGCAQYLTAPGRCRRRMARNKYSLDSARPQMLRGMTATHVLLCARCQAVPKASGITTPRAVMKNESSGFWGEMLSTSGGIQD